MHEQLQSDHILATGISTESRVTVEMDMGVPQYLGDQADRQIGT